ncbi:MarR family winged helix-turn-helix transcriptional regulator [Novosphingobium lentum]|uniref:MarR family winged helix-turn-helix transcriptional regulator n=1 Tax=Novosphingobium lentum TaxID=145287 RepID=UPI0008322F1B|nr:MarR family transcriptional regulator [Novosphingobium lentum]
MQSNIAFLATDIGRLFRKRFDVTSRDLGVTGPQWRMLMAIERTPGINQGALAAWLEVEAITAGRMIDRLERAGLVERRADPADRRTWRLYLSEAAKPMVDRLRRRAATVIDEAVEGFTPAEHEQLISLLQRVRCNLSDETSLEAKLVHG